MAAPTTAPPAEAIASVTPLVANFPPPYDKPVSAYLKISNHGLAGHETLAFKVKTTAPKRYHVHPNLGTVAAGESATIQLILHAPEPATPDAELQAAAHKDRFQVHVTPIDATRCRSLDDLRDMWTHLDEDKAVKFTVKCRFKPLKPKPDPAASAPGTSASTSVASAASGSMIRSQPLSSQSTSNSNSTSRELPALSVSAVASGSSAPAVSLNTSLPLTAPSGSLTGSSTSSSTSGTSQDKYEATLAHMERVRETQLADPANVGLVLDERRRLKQKVEELQTRLREVLADRDRLALQLRSAPTRSAAATPSSDFRSHLLLYLLLVIVAYLFGKWY